MKIVKSEIHGAVVDKFVIRPKNGPANIVLLETMGDKNEPAVFNTKNDVEKYLNFMEFDKEERENIKVESTNITYFNNGGILIEFED